MKRSEYLCNLIVPGAAKSGTSSLHEYLDAHPAIAMSSAKEPHHFCIDALHSQGAERHNALFKEEDGIRWYGESSTGYLPWEQAAKRIATELAEPKAIILLRDPVQRCFSHYRWRFRLGLEKRSFLQAMKSSGSGYHPEQATEFGYMAYLEFSNYARQVAVWERELGHENCLVLSSNDLRDRRKQTLKRCFAFLYLPAISFSAFDDEANTTQDQIRRPSRWLSQISRIVPADIRSAGPYQVVKDRLLKISTPTPPSKMTAEEKCFAEEALAEDIAWFEARGLHLPFAEDPEQQDEPHANA